jgi:hypothetical protein
MTDDRPLEKELALVQTLYAKTRAGAVTWEEALDAPFNAGFQTQLGNFKLRLRQIPDRDYPDQPDYELLVEDYSGKELEKISNTSLRPVMDRTTPDGLSPYNLLDRTYEIARRQALRIDEALETILEDLARV